MTAVLQLPGVDLFADISLPFVLGMALLAFAIGAAVAILYRLVMDARTPWHLPIILGVGAVGLWMNTASTIVQFIEQTAAQEPLLLQQIETNSLAIVASGVASVVGARFGDGMAPNVQALAGLKPPEKHVGKIVRTIGRFIAVQLPRADAIDDLEGYEPVDDSTKESVGGAEFLFPRGLTLDQLHRRVVDRLRDDYGIGHVDLELTDDGTVTHLAIGSRQAGIGPTLPARRGAIAIRTRPPPRATPGDRVQVWRATDAGAERLATAELRAADDDVATIVTDVRRLAAIDQSEPHELVTLRAEKRPELEFASLLRAANESIDTVEITEGSPLAGIPVGAISLAIVAIRSAEAMHPAPPPTRVCEPGDTVYVIGRPDELRKFRTAAGVADTETPSG